MTGDVPGQGEGRYDLVPVNAPRPIPKSFVAGLSLVVGFILSVSGLGFVGYSPATAEPAQDPAFTTTTVSAFPATTGAAVQTTALGPTTAVAGAGTKTGVTASDTKRVAEENRKIWLVVGGLVLVALGITLLTVRYWRYTRPVPLASTPAQPGRHSRRAVAGADHAAADEQWEPRGTGEHDRVEASPAGRPNRPDRGQREAAYQAPDEP